MEHYDLCVIGAGPAGYAAAMRALDFGKNVLLIERDRVGGTGIYNGALSSKTLWEVSQRVSSTNELMRGRDREPFRLTWEEIHKSMQEAIFDRKYLYACHIQLLMTQGYKHGAGKLKHERGVASIVGPNMIAIENGSGSIHVRADNVVIATGSRPRSAPGVEVDEERIMTSDGIFNITALPKSIVIIGAGVIGCEFATIFSNLGSTKVHLVDRAERILPFEDSDVSDLIAKNLQKRGVVIHRSASLERIGIVDDQVEYSLSYPDGRSETIRVEKALVSVGRTPNIRDLGLENAGVEFDPETKCPVIKDTATSQPWIHIVGDASSKNMLVNLGEMEGRHAIERIWSERTEPLSYDNASTIMFLDPEVAGVGLNERQCQQRGLSYRVARIDYSCLARAIAMRRTTGFFKVIVTNDDHMRVLGMRAVGEHASSAIEAVALMIKLSIPINELAELIHPHPSITEGVQECARMLLGKSIFNPSVFDDRMRCYTWTPALKDLVAA